MSRERLSQDPREVNAYLRTLRGSAPLEDFRRVRAIFIGHGGTGKSSLVAALHGEPVVEGGGEMTRGVEIQDAAAVLRRMKNFPGKGLAVHFWDFGGQMMAHATHQFFLRARCLYVIVLDGRPERNANEEAEYWLAHVRAFGDSARVLLVGNKIDQAAVNVDFRTLKEKHPNIQRQAAYGTVYGMQKTTVYIPEDVKRSLGHVAAARGVSEAELIREALRMLTSQTLPPNPRVPLFKSGKPRLAERVDEALSGFGES